MGRFRKVLGVCLLLAASCNLSGLPREAQAIRLSRGQVFINGEAQPGRYAVSQSDFKFLYFYVPSQGLFIISNAEFPGSMEAGRFERERLEFSISGVDFKLVSARSMLGKEAQPAWVRFDLNFKINSQSIIFGYGDTESAPYDWPNHIKSKQ